MAKQEDLKEMGDISSGMSSSIMQIYLKQVLEAFFHTQSTVRHFALSVITLTLSQGLIHPVQVRTEIALQPKLRHNCDHFLRSHSALIWRYCEALSHVHLFFSVCSILDCHGN